MRFLTTGCLLGVLVLFAACEEPSDPFGDRNPAEIEVVTTELEGEAGSTVTATVRVVDGSGDGVGSIDVTWSASAGSVDPEISVTDASGEASTSWTLGTTAGEQELTATVAGVDPAVVTAEALAAAGDVTFTGVTEATLVVDRDTVQLEVEASDANGESLAAGDLTWTSSDADVVTVSGTGQVVAVGVGSAVVVAAAAEAADTASFDVTPQAVRSLESGILHACALDRTGAAHCWGANNVGQLGNGDTLSSSTPVAVSGGLVFEELVAGGHTTCARTSQGEAYCWGSNSQGVLGSNATEASTVPVAVSGGIEFEQIAVSGFSHACGIDTSGQAYCWGFNRDGQLGTGDTLTSAVPVAVSQGGLSFTSISVGLGWTCATADGGTGYCWGNGSFGGLGTGDTDNRLTPTQVSGGLGFDQLQAAATTTCGIADGSTYCWGTNFFGNLGLGSVASSQQLTPATISGGQTFGGVFMSDENSVFSINCGVLGSDGSAYCWGANWSGALGVDNTTDMCGPLVENGGEFGCEGSPVAVQGGHSFLTLTASASFACGIADDGSAYCWGVNGQGQLGSDDAASVCSWSPDFDVPCSFEPLPVSGGLDLPQG